MAVAGISSLRGKDFSLTHVFPPYSEKEEFYISVGEAGKQIDLTLEQATNAALIMRTYEYIEDRPNMQGGGPNGYYNISKDTLLKDLGVETGSVALGVVDVVSSKPTTKKTNNARILLPVLALVAALVLFNK